MSWPKRTHCPRGHTYDAVTPAGSQRCTTCTRINDNASRARRRHTAAAAAELTAWNAAQRRCRDAYHDRLHRIDVAEYAERLAIRTCIQDTAA